MCDFKVGDVVVAMCDLSPNFQKDTVDTITDIIHRLGTTKLKLQNHSWIEYSAKHFDSIIESLPSNVAPVFFNQNIRLIIQDKAVILIDKKGNKGLARCHPADTFDFNVAVLRAVRGLLKSQADNEKE